MSIIDRLKYIIELDTKGFTASAKTADQQVSKLSTSIGSKLATALKTAIAGYIGWRGLNMAVQLGKEGAAAERLAISFDNIATSMNLSSKSILAGMKKMSADTVSEVQLMTQASRAAIFGLPMEQLPKLMEIARAAALGFGQTTTYMFESIVLGIARKSRLILDNLGIIIDEEILYKKETERLGHALSETEKRQAYFAEALRRGQNVIDRVGNQTDNMATKQEQLAAAYANARVKIGQFINEGAGPFLDFLTSALETIANINTGLDEFATKTEKLSQVAKDYAEESKKSFDELKKAEADYAQYFNMTNEEKRLAAEKALKGIIDIQNQFETDKSNIEADADENTKSKLDAMEHYKNEKTKEYNDALLLLDEKYWKDKLDIAIHNNRQAKLNEDAANKALAESEKQTFNIRMKNWLDWFEKLDEKQKEWGKKFIASFAEKGIYKAIFGDPQEIVGVNNDIIKKEFDQFAADTKEILYELGQIQTQGLIDYYNEALKIYELTADKRTEIEKRIYKLKLELFKELIEEELAIEKMIREAATKAGEYKYVPSQLPTTYPNLLPGYQMPSPPADTISEWENFWYEIEDVIGKKGTDALYGAFQAISDSLDKEVRKMLDTFVAAMQGDWSTVAYNFVSSFIDIFTGGSGIKTIEQLNNAIEALNENYQRQIDLIEGLTIAENEQRLLQLQTARDAILASHNLANTIDILRDLGIEIPNMATWTLEQIGAWLEAVFQNIQDQINGITGVQIDQDTLRGIQSFQELFDYITDNPDMGFDQARNLINHFVEMFDLTAEQQLELWQQLYDMLEASGNWTLDQQFWLDETIKNLQDLADATAETAAFAAADKPGISDQIYRSITTITQTQANAMQAILNSIHYDTSELVRIGNSILSGLTGGYAGGGVINISGGININGANNGQQMAAAFVGEMRSRGVKVGY